MKLGFAMPHMVRLKAMRQAWEDGVTGADQTRLAKWAEKLGYAMMDSPVGTAAWIIEAFHAWSDRRERTFEELFTPDQLLTEVMLYIVTDAFPTSTWIYGAKREEETTLPPGRRVTVPTGLAAFPDPVFPMPSRRVAQLSHDVVQYTEMAEGGHFPFYEAPDLLVDDLREFLRVGPRSFCGLTEFSEHEAN